MAVRIHRRRTKGWRMPANARCVTRPGKWGNPWKVGYNQAAGDFFVYRAAVPLGQQWCRCFWVEDEAARHAVRLYRRLLTLYRVDLSALRGKDLCCYCPPSAPCHADVLLELANG